MHYFCASSIFILFFSSCLFKCFALLALLITHNHRERQQEDKDGQEKWVAVKAAVEEKIAKHLFVIEPIS